MPLSAPLPSRPPAAALRVTGLACRRGEALLFSGLDLAAEGGTALLLRGPNGAGKTTLLTTLAGLRAPEAGAVVWTGPDAGGPPSIHFSGHQTALKSRLTVAENLRFWAEVNGPDGLAVPAALERVGLLRLAGLEAGHLSSGQGRRLALARLLVTRRPVWLLDEPTAALDDRGAALVAELVDAHLDLGGLVVAATHYDLAVRDRARLATLALGQAA